MFGLFNRPPRGFLLFLFKLTRRYGFRTAVPRPADIAEFAFTPDPRWGEIIDIGTALSEAGRFEDADIVFESGLFAFPEDPVLRIKHALSANNSGRYKIAIRRWEEALRVAEDQSICHVGLAANFRETGDLLSAQHWISGALERWPTEESVVGEAARVAERAEQFDESVELWARLLVGRRPQPDCLRGYIYGLARLGRFEEARDAVRDALALYPSDHRLLAVEAFIASAERDWLRAAALWDAYRQRFPEDRIGHDHYAQAIEAGRVGARPAPADRGARAPRAAAIVDMQRSDEMRELLDGFESIGDNCEFGIVQRRYGVDEPGLLRWTDLSLDSLIEILENRFDRIGDREHTDMNTLDTGEYVAVDRRWDLRTHTFLFEEQIDREGLHRRTCRQIKRLRDKLVAELEASEKIFVFRSAGLTEDRIETLHRALWAYGPTRLLAVQPFDAPTGFHGEPGQVMKLAERRYIGFLDKLGAIESGKWKIAFDDWIAVCRAAAA